jgi:hypothetical protein
VNVNIQLQFSEQNSIGSPGELTISVIDPQQTPEQQRLGLWKFSRHQTDSMVYQNDGQPSISTSLIWQHGPVQNESLLLFVRLKTEDGRTLEKSMQFNVATGQSRMGSDDQNDNLNGVSDETSTGEIDAPLTSPNRATQNGPRNWQPVR